MNDARTELYRQNAAMYDQFVADNNELDRVHRNGGLDQFVAKQKARAATSQSESNDHGKHETEDRAESFSAQASR